MKKIEVVAAIIREGDKILATQRGYGEFAGSWEFPGGKMESGESQKEALVREILEELKVKIEVQEFVYTIEYDYPTFHLTMHCYFARVLEGNIELTEHQDAKWLNRETLMSVEWLPADVDLVEQLNKTMER